MRFWMRIIATLIGAYCGLTSTSTAITFVCGFMAGVTLIEAAHMAQGKLNG